MKKILGILLGALLFGAVAGVTVVGVTKIAGGTGLIHSAGEEQLQQESSGASAGAAQSEAQSSAQVQPAAVQEKEIIRYSAALPDVSGIVEAAMPQVVSITNTMVIEQYGYSSIFDYFYGGGGSRTYEVPASGSGVILDRTDTELLVVTNNHVVEDATKLQVTFIDGETVEAAVKGTDKQADIAVIAVQIKDLKSETLDKIKVATLNDAENLKVGQGVIAIGNALGFGQTVTVGYISALDREITSEGKTISNLIQIDAAINPGNSGGALLNADGEVIGINVAKAAATTIEGVGYSIPIYKAKSVIDNLSSGKTQIAVSEEEQGRLGIYMNSIPAETSRALGFPIGIIITGFSDELMQGFDADNVMESPAKNAGLLKNDIITHVDGKQVTTAEELADIIKCYKAGEEIEITYQRLTEGNYNENKLKVVLGSKKDKVIEPVNAGEQKDISGSGREGAPKAEEGSGDGRGSRPGFGSWFGDGKWRKPGSDKPEAKDGTTGDSDKTDGAERPEKPGTTDGKDATDGKTGTDSGNAQNENGSGSGDASVEDIYDMFREFMERYR